MTVTVVGLDGARPDPRAEAALAEARLVVGGRRHLDMVDGLVPDDAERPRVLRGAAVAAGGAAPGR